MIIKFCNLTSFQSWCTTYGKKRWRWLECILTGKTFVHSGEVNVPRDMDRLWVLFPVTIHFFDIVSISAVRERIIRRRWSCSRQPTQRRRWQSTRCARQAAEGLPTQHCRGREGDDRGREETVRSMTLQENLKNIRLVSLSFLYPILCRRKPAGHFSVVGCHVSPPFC